MATNPFLPKTRRRRRTVPTVTSALRSRSARRMPQRTPAGMQDRTQVSLPNQRRVPPGLAKPLPGQGNAWGRPNYQLDGRPNTTQQGPNTRAPDPNTLIGQAGHDPLARQRYWASQGYLLGNNGQFRPAADAIQRYLAAASGQPGDRYTGPNPGGRPNPAGGGRPGPGGPGGGGSPGGPGPGPGMGGLPLDPYFMAQRRLLDDALAGQLGTLAPQRAQIAALQALQEARLGTNQGLDQRNLLEILAERGAMGGGVQRIEDANLATDYMRQHQDLANQSAASYGDLARYESEARLAYAQQLAEALNQSAARSQADPYAVAPTYPTGPAAGPNQPRTPWKPTWEPKWQPPKRRRAAGGGR